MSVKAGKWLSNTYDPRLSDAREHFGSPGNDQWWDDQWKRHLWWVDQNVIGEPKSTATHTVQQLKAMHKVGLYKPDAEPAGEGE